MILCFKFFGYSPYHWKWTQAVIVIIPIHWLSKSRFRELKYLPKATQLMGHEESDTTEWFHFHFLLSCNGEGNGNPLQCSCLENPKDGGAWWAAVYGVAQSRTWLKQLSSSSSRPENHMLWLCHCPSTDRFNLRNPTLLLFMSFPGSSNSKESTCNAGDLGSIPGLGRAPGGVHGNPLHYSYLENPHGQRSLAGYSPWGRKETDVTERLSTAQDNIL